MLGFRSTALHRHNWFVAFSVFFAVVKAGNIRAAVLTLMSLAMPRSFVSN
jgi:hypothetical protein